MSFYVSNIFTYSTKVKVLSTKKLYIITIVNTLFLNSSLDLFDKC